MGWKRLLDLRVEADEMEPKRDKQLDNSQSSKAPLRVGHESVDIIQQNGKISISGPLGLHQTSLKSKYFPNQCSHPKNKIKISAPKNQQICNQNQQKKRS